MDIASGKKRAVEALAPHTRSCRCWMETCVQESEPERWAQYLRRRGAEAAAAAPEPQEGAPGAQNPIFTGLGAPATGEYPPNLVGIRAGPGPEGASSTARVDPERSLPADSSGSGGQNQDMGQNLIHKLCQVDVSEVFSPPRVSLEAVKFGMMAGDAMDLTTGWDFTRRDHQRKAEELVNQQKPLVLIGSPP